MKATQKLRLRNTLAVTLTIAVLGIALLYFGRRDALQIADHGSVNLPLPRDFTMRIIYADSAAVRDNISDLVGRVVAFDRDGSTKTFQTATGAGHRSYRRACFRRSGVRVKDRQKRKRISQGKLPGDLERCFWRKHYA
jgi:hypothetical protein